MRRALRTALCLACASLACTPACTPDKGDGPTPDDTAGGGDDGGDDDGEGDDPCDALPADDPCCLPQASTLVACPADETWTTPIAGSFSACTPGDGALTCPFTATTGETDAVTFYGDGAGLDLVGDLSALGEVVIAEAEGCSLGGEGPFPGVFAVHAPDGRPLRVVGTWAPDATGELTVTYDEADETCPVRPLEDHCWELGRAVSLTFIDGGEALSLLPGQQGTLGDLEVHLLKSSRFSGELDCDDVEGQVFNWVVVGAP